MSKLNLNNIKYIVVHCSATKENMDIGLQEIDEWHKSRGWSGCGYHFIIRRNPNKYNTTLEISNRTFQEVGAHAKGFNSESIGVCLVGGLDELGNSKNNFTSNQFSTLKYLLLMLRLSFPKAIVLGHRDLPDVHKDCPCFDVKTWVSENIYI